MMPPVLWLVTIPLVVAVPAYLLRRTWSGAVLASAAALVLAGLVLRLSPGPVLNILGRTVEIDPLSQVTLALLYTTAAVLFLVPVLAPRYRAGRHSGVTGQEQRVFYPIGLVVLAVLTGASLSRHLGITALFIEAAALLTVVIIQGERLDSVRAGLRFLVLMSLATPLFLLAAWRVDQFHLGLIGEASPQAGQAVFFVVVGFALWLAVVPFHGWLTAVASESSPATAVFTMTAIPLIAFSTLVQLLVELPWLVDSPQLVQAIVTAGLLTALVGGVLALVQRSFSRLMGYAGLYNLGVGIVVVGLGGPAAVTTLLTLLTVRALGLALTAMGVSTLRGVIAGDGFAQVRGAGWRLPVAAAGITIGGLVLAGAPLTAGFAPQWQVLQSLAAANRDWAVLLVVGGLGVAGGYLRGLYALTALPVERQAVIREPGGLVLLTSFLAALVVIGGLFPAWLVDLYRAAVGYLNFPIG
ncbi:MAG: hypothetical protein D6784_15745 [Chloroflexi bacterium]|nr:MAG: hypothetical protein D6784_15745 [Chloroflexota bacterium]